MKNIESQFNKIKVVKKYYYVFLVLLFLQSWWLWQYREQIINDYAFISQKKSIALGQINSVEVTSSSHYSVSDNKEYDHDVFEYSYMFVVNGIRYVNKEFSLEIYNNINKEHSKDKNFYIENLIENREPKSSTFTKIKTPSEFYKEHFKLYKNIYVEYLKTNPKINRIEKFAEIKTKFDFFREYFLYKIISLIVLWLFLKYAESRPAEN